MLNQKGLAPLIIILLVLGLLTAGGVFYMKTRSASQVVASPSPSPLSTELPSPTPTIIPSSLPTTTPTPKPATSSGKLVSCKGPDGKYSQKTQSDCDTFNKAWGTPTPQPTQNNSSSNASSQPSNNTASSSPNPTSAPTTGTITGTIKDGSGNPLANAAFQLTCTGGCTKLRNGYIQDQQADGSGNFTVSDLPISTNITATPFYAHWGTPQTFSLEPGQTLTLNLVVN